MAPNPLQKDFAGQFVLNDWLGQLNNEATFQTLVDVLVPVQEMKNFQRRFRTQEVILSILQAERATFAAVVPSNEAWRLLWAGIVHGDSTTHEITLQLTPNIGIAKSPLVLARRQANGGQNVPLYPSKANDPGASNFAAATGPAYEFLPGDTLGIIDNTAHTDVGPDIFRAYIRYEIIPIPRSHIPGDLLIGVVI